MENDEDLETLGEKLYNLIYPKYTEMAPKLTGMLLELPASVVSQMLYDEALLNKALERALTALNSEAVSHTEDPHPSVSSDSLGEQLYDLIDLYNTGHTQKITGMLLEQKKEAVPSAAVGSFAPRGTSQDCLENLAGGEEGTDVSDGSNREDVESIGETLFNILHQLDPTHCADITGMLLETDSVRPEHVGSGSSKSKKCTGGRSEPNTYRNVSMRLGISADHVTARNFVLA